MPLKQEGQDPHTPKYITQSICFKKYLDVDATTEPYSTSLTSAVHWHSSPAPGGWTLAQLPTVSLARLLQPLLFFSVTWPNSQNTMELGFTGSLLRIMDGNYSSSFTHYLMWALTFISLFCSNIVHSISYLLWPRYPELCSMYFIRLFHTW